MLKPAYDSIAHLRQHAQTLRGYLWPVLLVSALSAAWAYWLTNPELKRPEYRARAEFTTINFKNMQSLISTRDGYYGFGISAKDDLRNLWAALRSDSAYVYIVNQFKLAENYGVANLPPYERAKRLRQTFEDKIHINVTSDDVVRVEVYDENPHTAARIANQYILFADSLMESVARRRALVAAKARAVAQMDSIIANVEDTLGYLRKTYGVYHFNNSERQKNYHPVPAAVFMKPGFHLHYDQMFALEIRLRLLQKAQTYRENDLKFMREELTTYPSLIQVLARATPSSEIFRPERGFIAGVTFVIALLFFCVVLAAWEMWFPARR